MKKYVRKQAIVDAVKWDGKLETIKNNEWLEMAVKEEKFILGVNDIDGKEATLIVMDEFYDYFKVCEGDYIIRERYNQMHKIRIMKSYEFEQLFEVIDNKPVECTKPLEVKVDLDTDKVIDKINRLKDEIKMCLNNSFTYVNDYILMQINDDLGWDEIESIEERLSKKIGSKVVILPRSIYVLEI